MSLLIARHGQAIGATFGMTDAGRWLTAVGRKSVVAVGAELKSSGLAVGAVVTSPLVRAVQTAELLAAALGFEGEIVADEALVPEASPAEIMSRLGDYPGPVLLVSHEPLVSALWRYLGGEGGGFRTGEIRRLEGDPSPS